MSPRDPSHKTANRYSDNETESDDVNCESESLVPRLAGPGERAAPSVSTAVPSLETRDTATVNLMISATVFHFLPGRHAAPLEDNTGDDDTERQLVHDVHACSRRHFHCTDLLSRGRVTFAPFFKGVKASNGDHGRSGGLSRGGGTRCATRRSYGGSAERPGRRRRGYQKMTIPNASSCTRLLTPSLIFCLLIAGPGAGYIRSFLQ